MFGKENRSSNYPVDEEQHPFFRSHLNDFKGTEFDCGHSNSMCREVHVLRNVHHVQYGSADRGRIQMIGNDWQQQGGRSDALLQVWPFRVWRRNIRAWVLLPTEHRHWLEEKQAGGLPNGSGTSSTLRRPAVLRKVSCGSDQRVSTINDVSSFNLISSFYHWYLRANPNPGFFVAITVCDQ